MFTASQSTPCLQWSVGPATVESIIFRQQDACRASVCFSCDPDFSCIKLVRTQYPELKFNSVFISSDIVEVQITPVACYMTLDESCGIDVVLCTKLQCVGCDDNCAQFKKCHFLPLKNSTLLSRLKLSNQFFWG